MVLIGTLLVAFTESTTKSVRFMEITSMRMRKVFCFEDKREEDDLDAILFQSFAFVEDL